MNPATAIEALSLRKIYGSVTAIEDLSLTVNSGEIFGLLGPNGAGKSTTLRILITVLQPTTGEAFVLGHNVVTEADTVRSKIGYVPQERAIDRFLTGREHLRLLGSLYHLPKAEAERRIQKLLKLVDLEEQADRIAKTYSGGMKRKLDIACGLLPNPDIVFLDEPTLGLDVQSRLRIWEYIRQLRQDGITIVITTNYLEEADQLCDRLAIIDGGKIRVIGSPKELKASLGGDSLCLTVKEDQIEKLSLLGERVKALSFVKDVQTKTYGLDIRVESSEKSLPTILEISSSVACQVDGIEYHRPRLEDVFVAYTGHALKGEFPDVEPE